MLSLDRRLSRMISFFIIRLSSRISCCTYINKHVLFKIQTRTQKDLFFQIYIRIPLWNDEVVVVLYVYYTDVCCCTVYIEREWNTTYISTHNWNFFFSFFLEKKNSFLFTHYYGNDSLFELEKGDWMVYLAKGRQYQYSLVLSQVTRSSLIIHWGFPGHHPLQ